MSKKKIGAKTTQLYIHKLGLVIIFTLRIGYFFEPTFVSRSKRTRSI